MSRTMVPDERRDAVFSKLRLKPGNKHCFDCGSRNPSWATPTFGVFVCLNCSASHRRMGVHISFMRSCELDSWSESQLQRMVAGGNETAKQFFAKKGWRGQKSKIEEKYHSRAAGLYKAHLDRVASSAKLPASPERKPAAAPLTGFQALALHASKSSPTGPPGMHTRSSSAPSGSSSAASAFGVSATMSPAPLRSSFVFVHKKPKKKPAAAPAPAATATAAPSPPTAAAAPAAGSPAAPSVPGAAAPKPSGLSMGGLKMGGLKRGGLSGGLSGGRPSGRMGGLGGGRVGGLGGGRVGGLGGGRVGGLGMGGLKSSARPSGGGLRGGLGARKIGSGKATLGASKLRAKPTATRGKPVADPDQVLGSFEDAERQAQAEAAAAAKRQEDADAALAKALQEQEDGSLAAALAGGVPTRGKRSSRNNNDRRGRTTTGATRAARAPAPAPTPTDDSARRERLRSGEFAGATAISSDMLFQGNAAPSTTGRGRARTSSSDIAEFVGSIGGQVASDLGKAASRIGGLFKKPVRE